MTALAFLAQWGLRSAILIAAGMLLLRALRVKDAAVRLAAYVALLFGSFAIPAMVAALPSLQLPVAAHATAAPVERLPLMRESAARPIVEALPSATPHPASFDWTTLVGPVSFAVYVFVAAAMLIRIAIGLIAGRRLVKRCRIAGETQGVEIRESNEIAAPAAIGAWRTVILLPGDWRDWPHAKLEAVLAHERSHVRRRDPAVQLASAIHRALLWHNPLSWLLHRGIVRAAEDASDDDAIATTRDRASYAEALLDFLWRTPARAGVSMARYGGAEQRIERILSDAPISRGLTRQSVAAIIVLSAPFAYIAAAMQTSPAFDAASVKPVKAPAGVTVMPNGNMMTRKGSGVRVPPSTGGPGTSDPGRIHYPLTTLRALLLKAWDSYYEIRGPSWVDTEVFAVDATMPSDTTKEQFQAMLRNLIVERFGLKYHVDAHEIPGYELRVAKSGLKMKRSVIVPNPPEHGRLPTTGKRDAFGFPELLPLPPGHWHGEMMYGGNSRIICQWCAIADLARGLGDLLNSRVVDATGLDGDFDYVLTFAGANRTGGALPPSNPAAAAADSELGLEPLPDVFSAVQSQLGLKLEARKVAVESMVIDQALRTPVQNDRQPAKAKR